MIKTLLQVVGVLVALGGLALGWQGFEANDEIRRFEQEATKETAFKAYRKTGEEGDRKIAEAQQTADRKRTERNLWLAGAAVALVVGLALALLPSSRKRKAARPAPPPNPDAPAP